jgi:AcrR family transcriptional regulator
MPGAPPHLGPSGRRTQAERRRESTDRMLEAATQLFAQQGYERTTLAQIAEQAGYSSGLVAHRFGTKVELVRALTLEIQRWTRETLFRDALEVTSAVERIDRLVASYIDAVLVADTSLRALFVLMAESVGPLSELRTLFAEHNRAFVALFETHIVRGQAAGEISAAVDAPALAREIVGLLRGVTLLWLIDPNTIDPLMILEPKRLEIADKLRGPSTHAAKTAGRQRDGG